MSRQLLRFAVLCAAIFLAAACRREAPASEPQRPNILVVLLDDLRWDALGYAGHPHVRTPQIDRIANEGVNFKNAFCTTSLCSPSRASLLSGVYAHAHGVTNNFTEMPSTLKTFPAALQRGGVRHRLRRQVSHGGGERRTSARLRLLRHSQGTGQVLRYRVQLQRRAAGGGQGLLHDGGDGHGAWTG